MNSTTIWSVLIFAVFALAPAIMLFWIRDGQLPDAGVSIDNLLSNAGSRISETTRETVARTGTTLPRATNGGDRT